MNRGAGSAWAAGSGLVVRVLVVLATGFGGLAIQLAAVRRQALVLGGTASSSAWVLGVFLAGLGLGGLLAQRLRAVRRRPLRWAALGYAAVAAVALVGDPVARAAADRLGPAVAWLPGLLHPGLSALLMGAAFPLVFAGCGRAGSAVLVATNLAGSLVGAWVGGNLMVPLGGLAWTNGAGAAAYLLAAACLASPLVRAGAPHGTADGAEPTVPWPSGGVAMAAAAAGAVTLGHEVLLLRRMPYFLEGFQPTLSAVVAAVLAGAALGGYLAAGILRTWTGRAAGDGGRSAALRLAAVAALVGAAGALVALHEGTALGIARTPVASDAAFHLRTLAAAVVASWPVAVPLGMVVPALLAAESARGDADLGGDVVPVHAARLFALHGAGGLVGALAVGHWVPALAGTAVFGVALGLVVAGAVVTALGALDHLRPTVGVAVAAAAVGLGTFALQPGAPGMPFAGTRFDRPGELRLLAAEADAYGVATVAYDRRNASMVLFTDEFRAAETGPGTSYMRVLGHLPMLLADAGAASGGDTPARDTADEVAVIALGTGTTADALAAWPGSGRVLHVVELSPAVLALAPWFSGDGPLAASQDDPRPPWQRDERTVVHVADGRRWLARRAAGTVAGDGLDVVTMEPLLPYDPGTSALYSREFYELASSRLRPGGLCVQWVPSHAMPRDTFRTLLRTFAEVFPSTSVWLVDQATLLVGARPGQPAAGDGAAGGPDPGPLAATPPAELARRLDEAPEEVRATMHAAGFAAVADLRAALVVAHLEPDDPALDGAAMLTDDRPFLERVGHWSGSERLGFLGDNLEVLRELVARTEEGPEPEGDGWQAEDARAVRLDRLDGRIALARARLEPGPEAARAAVLALRRARSRAPGSTLLHREETLARRLEVERALVRSSARAAGRLARAWLQRDPGSARVQLAAGLGEGDEALRRAALAAEAVDPTLFERSGPIPVAAGTAVDASSLPLHGSSPLDSVDRLTGERTAARAAGEEGRAWSVAIRAAWPVRAARALVERRRARGAPLGEQAVEALRTVLDPASLRLFAEAVAADREPVDAVVEIGSMWRTDLALPPVLLECADSPDAAVRRALAALLGGRRSARVVAVHARLLRDPDLDVRRAAAVALFQTWGDRFAHYDPRGGEAERESVARALERLHSLGR